MKKSKNITEVTINNKKRYVVIGTGLRTLGLGTLNINDIEEKMKMGDDKMEKLQNLYAQDNKNFYVSDLIAGGYIFSDKKDFNKAKEYLEKGEKYNEKFDNLLNKVNLYTVFNKEKDEKRYKDELKKIYNGTPVMDLLDFIYSGIENYRDEKLSNSSDDLPFGSFYDENTGEIINGIADDDDENDNQNMNFEETDFYIFYVNYLSKKEYEDKKVLVGYNGIDGKEVTMSKLKEDINEIRDSRSTFK